MRLSCIHQYKCYRVICVVFVSQHTKSGMLTALRALHLAKYKIPKTHFYKFITVDFYRGFIYWTLGTGYWSLVAGNLLLVARSWKIKSGLFRTRARDSKFFEDEGRGRVRRRRPGSSRRSLGQDELSVVFTLCPMRHALCLMVLASLNPKIKN